MDSLKVWRDLNVPCFKAKFKFYLFLKLIEVIQGERNMKKSFDIHWLLSNHTVP